MKRRWPDASEIILLRCTNGALDRAASWAYLCAVFAGRIARIAAGSRFWWIGSHQSAQPRKSHFIVAIVSFAKDCAPGA